MMLKLDYWQEEGEILKGNDAAERRIYSERSEAGSERSMEHFLNALTVKLLT